MTSDAEAALRNRIERMLAGGLATRTAPFPEDDRAFETLRDELSQVPPGDLESKLVIAGLDDEPHPEQMRCQECRYFSTPRRWCALPELSLPVEPEWWCRFWRI